MSHESTHIKTRSVAALAGLLHKKGRKAVPVEKLSIGRDINFMDSSMNLQDELSEQVRDLDRALPDFQRSYDAASTVDLSKPFWDLSEDDRNRVDLLTQRFSAFQGTLHKKTFRTLTLLEGELPTPRDQVNMMETLGILSADAWMNIALEVHPNVSDHGSARRTEVTRYMLATTPIVLEAYSKMKAYCVKSGYLSTNEAV